MARLTDEEWQVVEADLANLARNGGPRTPIMARAARSDPARYATINGSVMAPLIQERAKLASEAAAKAEARARRMEEQAAVRSEAAEARIAERVARRLSAPR